MFLAEESLFLLTLNPGEIPPRTSCLGVTTALLVFRRPHKAIHFPYVTVNEALPRLFMLHMKPIIAALD